MRVTSFVFGLLVLLTLGCASTEKRQGTGQWVVMSTNAAAPRGGGKTNFASAAAAVDLAPVDRATYRQELEQRGVTGEVLQKVSEGRPLSLADIETLSRQEVPDDRILHYLHSSDTVYVLTTRDLEELRAAGLSTELIDYMLSTRLRPTVIPRYEYYPAYRPYYYEPFYGYPHHHYYHHPRTYPRSVIRKR